MTRMDGSQVAAAVDRPMDRVRMKTRNRSGKAATHARRGRKAGTQTQAARSKKQSPFTSACTPPIHCWSALPREPASIRLRTQASAGCLLALGLGLPCLLFPVPDGPDRPALPFPVALRLQCRTCTVWVCRCISPFLRAVPVHLLQPLCMQTKKASSSRSRFHCQVATEASCSLAVQVLSEPNRLLQQICKKNLPTKQM